MLRRDFNVFDPEGYQIYVYKCLPEQGSRTKAALHIVHGLMEHAARCERFAQSLNEAGYIVYASDLRGHGRTSKTQSELGYAGHDGFNWMVKDLYQITQTIKTEHPNLPIIIFAHSMGSLLAQSYVTKYGKEIDGLILSGTQGRQGVLLKVATLLAKLEMQKKGAKAPSKFLNKLVFGQYNKAFHPARTDFDWLSRDEQEVDKYLNDPYCGGIPSAGLFYDLFRGIQEMHRIENMRQIPINLKTYLIWGEKDPVGSEGKSIYKLIKEYKRLGLKNLSYKCYIDGRHEMLNETNRAEVTDDVINWLDQNFY